MVCCWVHSSVATTNEWINLSELHSAPPIQRDQQPLLQREQKTYLSMTCLFSLPLSLSPCSLTLWPLVSNKELVIHPLFPSLLLLFPENLQRLAAPLRIIRMIFTRLKHCSKTQGGNPCWESWSAMLGSHDCLQQYAYSF